MDEDHAFPYDIVAAMARMGLFGLPFPQEYGGMGGDYFALCLAIEELARVDSSVAITLEAGVSLGAMPVFRFGTDEQRKEWLPQLTSGEALAAFGLTEPDGGTDAGATRTRAALADGTWRIDGTKAFITNAGTDITRLITVTAVTGEAGTRKEISSLLVPVPSAGLSVAPPYSKVGWHASDTREVSLSGVEVPEANLLGERGRGFANFLSILDEGRIAIAALAVGLAQGCVDESIKYAGAAAGVRFGDRRVPVDPVQDRRHGGSRPHRPACLPRRGGADAGRQAVQEARGDGQALRVGDRRHERPRGDPDPWRLRLHERDSGRSVLARLQDPRDR